MIIDALNQFLRALVVNPTTTLNGDRIGGCVGFIKSLQKQCRDIKPDRIVVCWDGQGGSAKRRASNKAYKDGRKPLRVNWENNLSEEDTLKNKIWQTGRIMEYLNNMPVCQFMFDSVEADDIIAVLCHELDSDDKVIISSDKDFYQLLDNKTLIYRPVQNELKNKKNILTEFGIHPNNFAISRAISGDNSDNLVGVRGAGLSTVAKRFPFLKEEKSATFDDIFSHCKENSGKIKLYDSILESKELVKNNYKLMQLYAPSVLPNIKRNIRETLEEYPKSLNKTEIRKMFLQDGVGELDWEDLFAHMTRMSRS